MLAAPGALPAQATAPKPVAPKPSAAATRAADLRAGATLFAQNGCGACRTLAGARSHGAKAPDLDVLGLPPAEIVRQLTRGSIGMPSFKGRLSTAQIAQLAGHSPTPKTPSASASTTVAPNVENQAPPASTSSQATVQVASIAASARIRRRPSASREIGICSATMTSVLTSQITPIAASPMPA